MSEFLQTAITAIVPFLIVLTVVVTVHELGHFLTARACGVAVDQFSIGFGRPIVRWRDRTGVEWRIGWLPLGGYVKFAGDENEAGVPDQDGLEALRQEVISREGVQGLARYYHFKPVWQRAAISAAGPIANFLLAIVMFTALFLTLGEHVARPKIGSIQPGSAAATAGFRVGDVVVEAGGHRIDSFGALQELVQVRGDAALDFVVDRDGRRVIITARPKWETTQHAIFGTQRVGRLGIGSSADTRRDYYWKRYGPIEAVGHSVQRVSNVISTTVYYLGRIMRGEVSASQISGPLGIANATAKVAKFSAADAPNLGMMLAQVTVGLVELAAVISVGLGFMNLLPIPILDGGHLLFYAYEAVARKPLAAKVQAAGYRVGLALVLGLMLFATWNDLHQLRVFNIIGRLFS